MTARDEDFSFIVLSRNPFNGRLVAVLDDDEIIAEFGCEDDAMTAAEDMSVCRAWGYEIVEIAARARAKEAGNGG